MNTKFFERDVRDDVRHSLTLSARVWLIEMLRKDCMYPQLTIRALIDHAISALRVAGGSVDAVRLK